MVYLPLLTILEHFEIRPGSKSLSNNRDKKNRDEPGDEVLLDKDEARSFRGVAARLNCLSQDCPDLQFPVKQGSREMARPTRGSWKKLKRVARYLGGEKRWCG